MTDENKLISDKIHPRGVKWIDVRGKTIQTKSSYNKEEAIEIIKILKSFKRSKSKKISFGIVTLFRAQMELIADTIKRTSELKNMDITVGTTHRFQGDEKDIIIFSPAIAQGMKTTTLNWIHTTTQLLNVAITRARSILIIVGDKKKCNDAGGFLKSLLEHVESKKQLDLNFDSPIEEKLFKRLTKEGVKVLPQYETKIRGKKLYRLDFALFINDNKYDVEIDGDKAHSQKIEYDILRDIYLRIDGWKVRRYQASEINNNLDNVVKEIKRLC
jgi:very-short-patch-repair endonuclease